jgi:GntR family transcriptional regulator/MocR family aminotransferase
VPQVVASREAFPLLSWRAAWRRAGFRRPPAGALPPLGLPRLRRCIAQHVSRTQGIPMADKEVIVTGGREHGLRLVLQALGLTGSAVAFEEPGPPALRRALPQAPAALAVDGHGARVHELPPECRAIVISADAQVPHGHVLSAKRRAIAAQWADRAPGRHLIELACDTVSRPELSGLPRLSTLAGERTCLIGCFGELLTPGLQLGYVIVPRHVAAAAAALIDERGEQPPHVTQLAVESLLEDGTVVRLMHRLGRLYASKRLMVDRALATLGLRGAARGTVSSVVLRLPRGADAPALAAQLLERGWRVETLAPYHFSARSVPPALVLGYGHVPDPVLSAALDAVAEVARAAGRQAVPALARR